MTGGRGFGRPFAVVYRHLPLFLGGAAICALGGVIWFAHRVEEVLQHGHSMVEVKGALEKPSVLVALLAGAMIVVLVLLMERFERAWRALEQDLVGSHAKLAENEERLQQIMRSAADAILVVGADGRVASANPQASAVFGRTQDELEGSHLSALLAESETDALAWAEGRSPAGPSCACGLLVQQRELTALKADGTEFPVEVSVSRIDDRADGGTIWIVRDISERKKTEYENSRLRTAVEAASDTVVVTDAEGRIQYVNPSFERNTGYDRNEVIGETPRILKSGKHDRAFYADLWATILAGRIWQGRITNRRKDGSFFVEDMTISPVFDEDGRITNFVAVKKDATREVELEEQLRQSQKLEAIGQLAAGIAHEINTPTQYVGDNTRFLQESFDDLLPLFQKVKEYIEREASGRPEDLELAALRRALEAVDLEFLEEEIPRAIGQSLEGIARVTRIVTAMKNFSHPGTEERTYLNLNEAIRSTITVATNEWKYVAEVETDFDPDLPEVPCYPGEFNQVVLNLIVNAAHAIEAKIGREPLEKGKIRVSTKADGDWVEIRVADTGTGIPQAIRDRVFDPFFTTKEVGRGTGQGLSIAYNVVVKKHGGRITFETEEGVGTTFVIRLPASIPESEGPDAGCEGAEPVASAATGGEWGLHGVGSQSPGCAERRTVGEDSKEVRS